MMMPSKSIHVAANGKHFLWLSSSPLHVCVCVCVCVCNTEQAACGIPDFLLGHQEDCMQDAN